MKPFKSGKAFANWLLRIALALIIYNLYNNIISTWAVSTLPFILAAVTVIFVILLLVGGIASKSGLTIISGLAVAILSIYKIINGFNGSIDHYLIAQFIPLAIGFYFFTNGNDN
jgi:hypothetical protein